MEPYKTYQFIPPSEALKKMYMSIEFNELVDKKREEKPGVIEDVKDGKIWKEFFDANFFTSRHHLGLMLSVDWFRPFKRSEYKVAAILLTIMNLPREEKVDNHVR